MDRDLQLLLRLGDAGGYARNWPDYRTEFGLREEHVAGLIDMACDTDLLDADPLSHEAWAPVHAWRALGQLRAENAVEPLLHVMIDRDEDASDLELPIVLGMIGPAALNHLARFINDRSSPTLSVATAMTAVQEIASRHPDRRPDCLEILQRPLRPEAGADRAVAGFAVASLLDLEAVEAVEAIRDAYKRNAVDVSIPGDLEDAEIALGLLGGRLTPAPLYIHANTPPARPAKLSRTDPCHCGSAKPYEKCCLH